MIENQDQRTKRKIYDGIISCLEESHSLSFSLDQVAKAAGLSKGGLLYHFRTKESLLEGLVAYCCQQFDTQLQSLLDAGLSYGEAYVQLSLQPDTIRWFRLIISVCAAARTLLKQLRESYQQWDHRLMENLGSKEAALSVRLIIDGYLLSEAGELSPPSMESVKDILSRFLSPAAEA